MDRYLEVLRQQRAWVLHWADDAAAGLKPTPESLAKALADIDEALDAVPAASAWVESIRELVRGEA